MELPDYRKRMPNARRLRKEPTDAERALWLQIKDRRLEGEKFRRQVPIGPFIVDFLCLDRRLAIEVDGGQHSENRDKDLARTRLIEQQGFRVIRFWNDEVLKTMTGVLEVIVSALKAKPPRP